MKIGRFLFLVVILGAGSFFQPALSHAFWGFGEDAARERSGLDFDRGYDRNTETTVRGKVVSVEPREGSAPVIISISLGERGAFDCSRPCLVLVRWRNSREAKRRACCDRF